MAKKKTTLRPELSRPWTGQANVLPDNTCGHCGANLTKGLLTLSCWQCQSILIYPEKEKSVAKRKKTSVITDVYDTVWVGRANLEELADALNRANARAFLQGKKNWIPVGTPIVHSNCAEILVTRREELKFEERGDGDVLILP